MIGLYFRIRGPKALNYMKYRNQLLIINNFSKMKHVKLLKIIFLSGSSNWFKSQFFSFSLKQNTIETRHQTIWRLFLTTYRIQKQFNSTENRIQTISRLILLRWTQRKFVVNQSAISNNSTIIFIGGSFNTTGIQMPPKIRTKSQTTSTKTVDENHTQPTTSESQLQTMPTTSCKTAEGSTLL